jgi:hypothetical protein
MPYKAESLVNFGIFGKPLMPIFYSYGRIERALRSVFNISAAEHSRFQSRVKYIIRLGLKAAEQPIDGHIEYEQDTVDQWLVCLALLTHRADPVLAVKTIQADWHRAAGATKPKRELAEIVDMARKNPSDGLQGIWLLLFGSAVPGKQEQLREQEQELLSIGWLQPIKPIKRGGKEDMLHNWELLFDPTPDGFNERGFTAIPLGALVHRLDRALAAPRGELP